MGDDKKAPPAPGAIPDAVTDEAKKKAAEVAKGTINDAASNPGSPLHDAAKDVKKTFGIDDPKKKPAPGKGVEAPKVETKVTPDINPKVDPKHVDDKKVFAGSSAGAHVTVEKKDSFSVTAGASGGLDDKNEPQGKGSASVGVTAKSGPVTVTGKVEGSATLGKADGKLHGDEKVKATGTVEADVGGGVKVTGEVHGGVDVTQGAGSKLTPEYGGSVGLKYEFGGDKPKEPSAQPKVNARPVDVLAARIEHDKYVAEHASTPELRNYFATRAAAEQQTLDKHPELGKPQQFNLTNTGPKPNDFVVNSAFGKSFIGSDVDLPQNLKDEVQKNMQTNLKAKVQEQGQDSGPARPAVSVSGPGR